MRPENLKTKIFLDGGDPAETQEIIALLGFLDGQTTNPSLVAKNPQAQERISRGDKFSSQELLDFYKIVVSDTSALIPNGSISIEVYADMETRADAMLVQARQMNTWIPNAHIKFPTTLEGLEAAAQAVREGMRVNMTLCFTQNTPRPCTLQRLDAARDRSWFRPLSDDSMILEKMEWIS